MLNPMKPLDPESFFGALSPDEVGAQEALPGEVNKASLVMRPALFILSSRRELRITTVSRINPDWLHLGECGIFLFRQISLPFSVERRIILISSSP